MHTKGEVTSMEIISVVLSIAGFIILIFVLRDIFANGDFTSNEVCRLSILTRATAPTEVQAAVPLKCSTGKTCITSSSSLGSLVGKGTCKEFVGEEVSYIRLSGDSIAQETQLKEALANAMYDCWSVMGQGKLDLFGSAQSRLGLANGEATCVVCSRLAFADNVPTGLIQNAYAGLDSYLQNTLIPGQSITYLSAFTDRGTSTFPSTALINNAPLVQEPDSEKLAALNALAPREPAPDQSRAQIAFVFSQVKTESTQKILERWGALAVGSTFVSPGGLRTKAVVGLVGLVGGGIAAINNQFFVRTAAAGYCGNMTSSAPKSGGCSIVQAVPYTVPIVNELCPSIQGNP